MYKKIIALLVLFPSLAFADNSFQANPNQTTLYAQGQFGAAAVDTKGNVYTQSVGPSGLSQSVIPVSNATNLNGLGAAPIGYISAATDSAEAASTSTVINATSHTARVGDAIQFYSGTAANVNAWSYVVSVTANSITVGSAFPATVATSDNFYIWRPTIIQATNPATSAGGALAVAVDRQNQISVTGGLLKAEDAAHTTGDAGVAALGVVNLAYVTQAADGDYANTNLDRAGRVGIRGSFFEDYAFQNGDDIVATGGQTSSVIAQTVGTAGDVAPIAMDLGNRTVVTNAPAGETWYACTGEITTATNTSLKGLVASNRHYVTSFGCTATSTNPNQIYLTDGSGGTAMAFVNTTSNAVAPGPHQTYPVPLRGSSGVALFVTTITTGAVRCCAAGYISTI